MGSSTCAWSAAALSSSTGGPRGPSAPGGVVEGSRGVGVGLTGSSVWVRPVGAGPACGRGRAAGSGSPFGSGCVRSWAGGSSGSCTGWVTSAGMVSGLSAAASAPDVEDARSPPSRPARSAPIRTRPTSTRRPSGWSGFAFLRARAAAVRGRGLPSPVGLGGVGCVRAEAVMGSSTGTASSRRGGSRRLRSGGPRGPWGLWGRGRSVIRRWAGCVGCGRGGGAAAPGRLDRVVGLGSSGRGWAGGWTGQSGRFGTAVRPGLCPVVGGPVVGLARGAGAPRPGLALRSCGPGRRR